MDEFRSKIILEYSRLVSDYIYILSSTYNLDQDYFLKIESINYEEQI
jgi:hypothetical protein